MEYFQGKTVEWAILKFNPKISRWVANELWHPQQQGKYLADGFYELQIPYSNNIELIMDIMRYGDNVTVVDPELFKKEIVGHLKAALYSYKV